jgi:hypothetical protein
VKGGCQWRAVLQDLAPDGGVEERTSSEFFNQLAFLLQLAEPPHPNEVALRWRFSRLDIVPGKPFDGVSLSLEILATFKGGMEDGQVDDAGVRRF